MMLAELDMTNKVLSSVPAFLSKLMRMVDNPDTDYLISWTERGTSFVIKNQQQFTQSLLPYYYKHSNMASFIRQLNMYGFRKVIGLVAGALKGEKEEQEFAHPFFLKGQEHILGRIKRKIQSAVSKNNLPGLHPSSSEERVTQILTEMQHLNAKQVDMEGRFADMKSENDALWGEVMNLRLKYSQQQQTVNKLINFLSSVVQPSGRKRAFPVPVICATGEQLALQDSGVALKQTKQGEDLLGELLYPNSSQQDAVEVQGQQVAVLMGRGEEVQTMLINDQTDEENTLIDTPKLLESFYMD